MVKRWILTLYWGEYPKRRVTMLLQPRATKVEREEETPYPL